MIFSRFWRLKHLSFSRSRLIYFAGTKNDIEKYIQNAIQIYVLIIYSLTALPKKIDSYALNNKETEKQRDKKLRVRRDGNKPNELNL